MTDSLNARVSIRQKHGGNTMAVQSTSWKAASPVSYFLSLYHPPEAYAVLKTFSYPSRTLTQVDFRR
jgi:hypothetical protein